MDTPRSDFYFEQLTQWEAYCKRNPNMPPEQAEQCPIEQTPEEFARTLEIELSQATRSLENIRLLAGKHRREPWSEHALRFCKEAGVIGSPLRDLIYEEGQRQAMEE